MLPKNRDIHAKDTGIFVYEPPEIKPRELNTDLFYEGLYQRIEVLKDALDINFKLKLQQMDFGTDIIYLDDTTKNDTIQFCFHFCNVKQGIYVDRLILPASLSRKGITTFFVNWLKVFAGDLGFKYIILGSVAEARGFWTQMGFRILTLQELHNFPGYQGRYSY